MLNLRRMSQSREAAAQLMLEENLLGYELDAEAAKLVKASTHRLCAAHYYGAGEMREARQRIYDVCRTVGWLHGARWAGRLWLQTWLGATASSRLRRAKQQLTWR
jgi:hypothetical protein